MDAVPDHPCQQASLAGRPIKSALHRTPGSPHQDRREHDHRGTPRSPQAGHRTQSVRRRTQREPTLGSGTHLDLRGDVQRLHLPQPRRCQRLRIHRAPRQQHEHLAKSSEGAPLLSVRLVDRRSSVPSHRVTGIGITVLQQGKTARLSLSSWLNAITHTRHSQQATPSADDATAPPPALASQHILSVATSPKRGPPQDVSYDWNKSTRHAPLDIPLLFSPGLIAVGCSTNDDFTVALGEPSQRKRADQAASLAVRSRACENRHRPLRPSRALRFFCRAAVLVPSTSTVAPLLPPQMATSTSFPWSALQNALTTTATSLTTDDMWHACRKAQLKKPLQTRQMCGSGRGTLGGPHNSLQAVARRGTALQRRPQPCQPRRQTQQRALAFPCKSSVQTVSPKPEDYSSFRTWPTAGPPLRTGGPFRFLAHSEFMLRINLAVFEI